MDKALKQRLVGASVMIALAVVVLPMLLSGRPDGETQQSKKIELQSRPDELSFETRRFPVSDVTRDAASAQQDAESAREHREPLPSAPPIDQPPPVVSQGADDPGVAAETPTSPPDEEATDPVVADTSDRPVDITPLQSPQETVVESASEPVPASQPATAAGDGRYLVQVASLGSQENASRLMVKLQKQGYPVLMDTVKSDVGTLNRVRVGPYAKEAEASAVSIRIKNELQGVNPRVVDIKPEQAAAVTHPADPLVRWVVQVGSFSEAGNADRLVAQLRLSGMTAYSEEVSSRSATVYRVRVGPYLEREDALKAEQQLADSQKIDGVVMSAD